MRVRLPNAEETFYQLLHASDDRRKVLFVSTACMMFVGTMAVILRLIARRRNKGRFCADDYAILVALVGVARGPDGNAFTHGVSGSGVWSLC